MATWGSVHFLQTNFGHLEMLSVAVRETREAASVTRTISVSENGSQSCPDVFFEVRGFDIPALSNLDFAVLSTVFYAMRLGKRIHINGPVSSILLRNIEEFQEAWALWRPMYKTIKVTAESETDEPFRERTGVFAFSGGVDSMFALARHHAGVGRRTVKPMVGCLVHGFDIALDQQSAFDVAEQSAREALRHFDIPLAVVRTNWTDVLCGEWTNEFGAALAACLNQFSGAVGFGVMGADEDYAHLSFPWGSNPATNPFLSGSFDIVTGGGGFTRSERVKFIAKDNNLARSLRVCWEGERTGTNCGKCEKCIRTKLNFMANGLEPVCFSDGLPSLKDIVTINARGAVQRAYLREIISTARRNGIKERWVNFLYAGLANSLFAAIKRRFI